ncbi:MAG: arginine--tRNA ligase, partial [Muribaculaceae bacterium]|nr:arginine--tRNA ligase [Muribaculaceae bacterium]
MKIEEIIAGGVADAVKALYGADIDPKSVQVDQTRKDFEGHLTVVVFPYLKVSHKKPEETAAEIGAWLVENLEAIEKFNAVKG